jgi:hypothetical protein
MSEHYVRKDVTDEDRAAMLNKPPICDFCGQRENAVKYLYQASRTSYGTDQKCWRWCACADCAQVIEHGTLKQVAERLASFLDPIVPQEVRLAAAQAALVSFEEHAVWTG